MLDSENNNLFNNFRLPFQQLTYLQFCVFPSLFGQYVTQLIRQQKYKTMGDIFILFSQTLMELVPFPLGEDVFKSDLKYMQNSAFGLQMLKLLQKTVESMPIQHIDFLFSRTIPNSLYAYLTSKITDQKQKQQKSRKSSREENEQILILNSLPNYMTMLSIQQDIQKSRKIPNQAQIERLVCEYLDYFDSSISFTYQTHKQYLKKYQKLGKKLKYCLYQESPSSSQSPLHPFTNRNNNNNNKTSTSGMRQRQKQRQRQRQSSMDIEINGEQSLISSLAINEELSNVSAIKDNNCHHLSHLNVLYLQCASCREKLLFIRACFEDVVKSGVDEEGLRAVEFMCLIYLEELKFSKITAKLQVYLMLAAVKTFRNKQTSQLLSQLTMIFSFGQLPKIQFCLPLISSITNIPDQPPQLLDFLLKAYSKSVPNSDKSYLKLALMITLYTHHKATTIKNSSRKLHLQKICELSDVIDWISNQDILHYVMQLVFVGRQVGLGVLDAGRDGREGDLGLMARKQYEDMIKEYVLKIVVVNDNEDIKLDVSVSQLIKIVQNSLLRLNKLQSPNPQSLFHNNLLSILLQPQPQLPTLLLLLQSYTRIAFQCQISDKTLKLIFLTLMQHLQHHYKKQAFLAYMLSGEKVSIQRTENIVRINKQQFGNLSKQLFMCIHGYDFVELLGEGWRGYQVWMQDWIVDDDNYVYNWPESKRDKVLANKRIRFINYLVRYLMPEDSQKEVK